MVKVEVGVGVSVGVCMRVRLSLVGVMFESGLSQVGLGQG